MKKLNCLVVEAEVLKSVFAEIYWNDNENIICVPMRRVSPSERRKLARKGLTKDKINGIDYLIAEYEL